MVVSKPLSGFCDNENALSKHILGAYGVLMHPNGKHLSTYQIWAGNCLCKLHAAQYMVYSIKCEETTVDFKAAIFTDNNNDTV